MVKVMVKAMAKDKDKDGKGGKKPGGGVGGTGGIGGAGDTGGIGGTGGKQPGDNDIHSDKSETDLLPSGSSFKEKERGSSQTSKKSSPSQDTGKDKKKPHKPKPPRPPKLGTGTGTGSGTGTGTDKPVKDCPCEICEFMKRRKVEPDSPLIRKLKRDEKRRELRDYLKRMCHRQYIRYKTPEYLAPAHRCDPIQCDNCFCTNPKLGEYCDCLDAMQKLQKLLSPKHRIVDNELLFNVRDLKDRVCGRFCECL